jgi:3-dehydroquinate dehydratase/shikimate dehydrogenase
MAAQVCAGVRQTPTIELRLDWLKSDQERASFLRWLKKNRPRNATFIATCRRRAGGGKFRGSVSAELRWLSLARGAGCVWSDLEIESTRSLTSARLAACELPRVLLSHHDFRRTPPLSRISESRRSLAADAIKVAAQARTIADSVRLMRLPLTPKNSHGNCVAVPMGEVGLPARILALREGSALAYAPIDEQTAPGQVSLNELKNLYRAHQLNGSTRVFGVIGDPIAHSLSPLLHNTGFIAAKLNAVYLPFLVKKLRDFLQAACDFGIRGFSVTLPHKTAILKYLEECHPLAEKIGAVNTVTVPPNGSLFGCNTDYVGVLRSLEKRLNLAKSRVLILGAGGSARAVAVALTHAGAAVAICSRRSHAAQALAKAVDGAAMPRSALRHQVFDAIVNATPVGMHPHVAISPLTASELNCRIVMDLIYHPQQTQLLKLAARQGIATISGVEMFLAQGIAQWEMWTKRRAPTAAMRRAVLRTLDGELSRQAAR